MILYNYIYRFILTKLSVKYYFYSAGNNNDVSSLSSSKSLFFLRNLHLQTTLKLYFTQECCEQKIPLSATCQNINNANKDS